MRTRLKWLPLAVAAVLAGLAVARAPAPGLAAELQRVELVDLARHGRDWLGREVRFALQVESQPETWNPYLTRFGTEDFRAAVVWGDEQGLWLREQYESPAALVFARRGSSADFALAPAARYERFDATGIVRQVFLGRPWIEVTALRPLGKQFGTGSLIHASRGMELRAAEHWTLAAQAFERALASDLPEHAAAELATLRDECLEKSQRPLLAPPRKKRD